MSAPKRLLITGATGFVGQCLVPYLQDRGYDLRLVGRREVGNFDGNTDWSMHLDGVDAVIHLAGRAHVMQEPRPTPSTSIARSTGTAPCDLPGRRKTLVSGALSS